MSMTVDHLSQILKEKLTSSFGKSLEDATTKEMFQSICLTMKESIHANWQMTQQTYDENESKQVYYFSMEFLLGRLVESNLLNMGMLDLYKDTLTFLGFDPEEADRIDRLLNGRDRQRGHSFWRLRQFKKAIGRRFGGAVARAQARLFAGLVILEEVDSGSRVPIHPVAILRRVHVVSSKRLGRPDRTALAKGSCNSAAIAKK